MRMPSLLLLSVLSFAATGGEADGVQIEFNDKGLSSLKWNGAEFLAHGSISVRRVELKDEKGDVHDVAELDESRVSSIEDSPFILHRNDDDFQIYVFVKPRDNALLFDIQITNKSDKIISALEIDLPALKFPQKPAGFDYPILGFNIDGPTVITADAGKSVVVFCNEDFYRPLNAGFLHQLDKDRKVWQLSADTGRRKDQAKFLPFIDRPIYPGGTDTYHLSLRFGPEGSKATDLAKDVYERYRAAVPMELNWPDRRPIAALFLSSSAMNLPGNPRGWLMDKELDVRSDEGKAKLKEKLLAFADGSITEMKKCDAQGCIIWDCEGQEFPHAMSYLGDPRSLPPEIDPVIDEVFKKFKDAGFKVGICVRPQLPVRRMYDNRYEQMDVKDIEANLKTKIEAAKKRWGCTLFYVDSNIEDDAKGRVVHSAAIYRNLMKAFPDTLFIPEHEAARHFAYAAPYNETRGGYFNTRPEFRAVYPNAFSVLYVADGPLDEHREELIQAVRQGDILLFRGWWNDPFNEKMRQIIEAAKKK